MEYKSTNGWQVINFTINDNSYHGFIKVTKKGEITITASRAELHCIKDDQGELKKSIQTKKKLKKALGDDNEPI